jgi:predicted dehydrogenase
VKKTGIIFGVGHVLRYSPYNQAVSSIIRSKALGEVTNIVHIEPVGYYHFAHSYVRGNWANEKESSFSLMTKSCHDIDILCHWFAPATPVRVSSFGSLSHFRKSSKPAAAGDVTRCIDCPVTDCPYDARKIYLEPARGGHTGWPISPIVDGVPNPQNVAEALENGPYGKCVYESNNDVVDNQVVNLEYSNGTTCSFTMVAFTDLICERQTRIHFTHGELVGDGSTFRTVNFRTNESKRHYPSVEQGSGHGGGDLGLISAFVEAVKTGRQEVLGTNVEEVMRSHLTVFAAEESRKMGKVVSYEEFERGVREKMGAEL